MHIFVSNLSFMTTDEELNGLFAVYGTVNSAQVILNKVTKRSRGFGYIEMPDDKEANRALSSLNNKKISGRALFVVAAAKPYDPSPMERE
ncbi:RNA recognition motif domain-containing protein [Foetidibacter luteolus]|uniref:RNA recognition motif domain-containing protein n=1 Tax=Foetidibacter luteolus TaxID=2608880 RepID=UPI00129BE1EC|nr:RNA-binding protein [Foetidibacter luteolus]